MNIIKKTIDIVLLLGVAALSMGCMSIINHNSAQNDLLKQRIYASGDRETIQLVQHGVKARDAVRIRVLQSKKNGDIQGLAFGVDILGAGSWLDTLKAKPVHTVGALAFDALGSYGLYKIGDNNDWFRKDSSSTKSSGTQIGDVTGDGNIFNFVDADNNSTVDLRRDYAPIIPAP